MRLKTLKKRKIHLILKENDENKTYESVQLFKNEHDLEKFLAKGSSNWVTKCWIFNSYLLLIYKEAWHTKLLNYKNIFILGIFLQYNFSYIEGRNKYEKEELEKYLETYYEDCLLRKRLSDKTLRAYEIDLKQYINFIDDSTEDTKQ